MAPQVFAWSLPTSQAGRLAATNIQNRDGMRDFCRGKLGKTHIPIYSNPTNHHVSSLIVAICPDFQAHPRFLMFLEILFLTPGKRTEARLRKSALSTRHFFGDMNEGVLGRNVSLSE